jgi:hypothetical protein
VAAEIVDAVQVTADLMIMNNGTLEEARRWARIHLAETRGEAQEFWGQVAQVLDKRSEQQPFRW